MVKLTRIYTRAGDDGRTALGTGARVSKTDPRVEAYGTVDEANAFVGAAVLAADPVDPEMADLLRSIQHDLFDVGADLCTPVEEGEDPSIKLRVLPEQTARLEQAIDRYNAELAPLSSFVLPGGSSLACSLHLARTVSRRAERLVAAQMDHDAAATSSEPLKYLNRLSDLLFVLARVANDFGKADVLWKPGNSRGS